MCHDRFLYYNNSVISNYRCSIGCSKLTIIINNIIKYALRNKENHSFTKTIFSTLGTSIIRSYRNIIEEEELVNMIHHTDVFIDPIIINKAIHFESTMNKIIRLGALG